MSEECAGIIALRGVLVECRSGAFQHVGRQQAKRNAHIARKLLFQITDAHSHSRGLRCPSFVLTSVASPRPLNRRRRREDRVPTGTRGPLRAKMREKCTAGVRVKPETTQPSLRSGWNGLWCDLPGETSSVATVVCRSLTQSTRSDRHVTARLDASIGRQDHAVLPYARLHRSCRAQVIARKPRLEVKTRPATTFAPTQPTSAAPRTPRIVTTRTPLFDEAGWREIRHRLREIGSELFRAADLDCGKQAESV